MGWEEDEARGEAVDADLDAEGRYGFDIDS